MPKPFVITIQVEESELGHVMRVLDRTEGVVTFDFDMDSRRAPPKRNGAAPAKRNYKSFELTGHEFLLQALFKANRPLHMSGLREAFGNAGRAPTSAASAVHITNHKGQTKSTPEGYVLTKTGRQRVRRAAAKEA